MKKLKLLYIFTSGVVHSANNKQWISLFQKNDEIDVSFLIQSSEKDNVKVEANNKCNFIFFPYQKEFFAYSVFKKIKIVLQFANRIKELNPDIVHIHGCYFTYPLKSLILSNIKAKIIFNIWGNDFNTKYFTSSKQKIIMNHFIRKSDLIWANWFSMEERLKETFPKYANKIRTILWGIEKDLFNRADDMTRLEVKEKFNIKDEYVILYAKGINQNNQQFDLLNVFDKIDRNLNYKFIIHCGGTPPDVLRLFKNKIKELELDEKIILSNSFLSDKELKALFDIADLSLVLPKTDQLTRTIFESIISNSGLILSETPPYKKLNSEFNFNFPLLNISQSNKFVEIISDKILKREKHIYTYENEVIKNKYIFENKTDDYIKIYKSLRDQNK